jgi:transcriptional regulator with XRE-family HTH domain
MSADDFRFHDDGDDDDTDEAPGPPLLFDAGVSVRSVRRVAGMSQRDLAAASGVPLRTVQRIESGDTVSPGVEVVALLAATGLCELAILDRHGAKLEPGEFEDEFDRAERRFPAHCPTRAVKKDSDWWFSPYITTFTQVIPRVTFDLPRRRYRRSDL